MKIDQVIPFLEFIQFFQNYYGDDDIIIGKIINRTVIVQNNVRIQHKCLFFVCSHCCMNLEIYGKIRIKIHKYPFNLIFYDSFYQNSS